MITELETRQKEVEALLADPKVFENSETSVPLLSEYKDVRQKLDGQMEKWENCHEELETNGKNWVFKDGFSKERSGNDSTGSA